VAFKRYNTVNIEYRASNLPRDWRRRVEQVVNSVGASFELNISSVKAGARKSPPGVLISIARDGAEEAWTAACERTVKQRVLEVLNHAKDEEIARQVEAMGLGTKTRESESSIRARERRRSLSPEEKIELENARRGITGELARLYAGARLPAEAADLVVVALKRMEEPKRWALWAQLLITVQETRNLLSDELMQRLRALLR
tara:strand:- start:658 stop:1260 length:603 start_codon:yes stop_codon:yes gene_type:complete